MNQAQGIHSMVVRASQRSFDMFNQLLFDICLATLYGGITLLIRVRDLSHAEGSKEHNARSV